MRCLAEKLANELPNARFTYRHVIVEGRMGLLEWSARAMAAPMSTMSLSDRGRSDRISDYPLHREAAVTDAPGSQAHSDMDFPSTSFSERFEPSAFLSSLVGLKPSRGFVGAPVVAFRATESRQGGHQNELERLGPRNGFRNMNRLTVRDPDPCSRDFGDRRPDQMPSKMNGESGNELHDRSNDCRRGH
jgi:hypothetical protein